MNKKFYLFAKIILAIIIIVAFSLPILLEKSIPLTILFGVILPILLSSNIEMFFVPFGAVIFSEKETDNWKFTYKVSMYTLIVPIIISFVLLSLQMTVYILPIAAIYIVFSLFMLNKRFIDICNIVFETSFDQEIKNVLDGFNKEKILEFLNVENNKIKNKNSYKFILSLFIILKYFPGVSGKIKIKEIDLFYDDENKINSIQNFYVLEFSDTKINPRKVLYNNTMSDITLN